MTDTTITLNPGEEVDEVGPPPPGFRLEGDAHPADPGIVTRELAPEPDDDDVAEAVAGAHAAAAGHLADDDAIDDPDDAAPIADDF